MKNATIKKAFGSLKDWKINPQKVKEETREEWEKQWDRVLYGERHVKGDAKFWEGVEKACEEFRHDFKMRNFDKEFHALSKLKNRTKHR
ncbi:hypothetical protein HYS48_02365 [Candidatus Woesearchaeota archaeon]|nr:hypothetical protein [Candidatus Woesearchaeota archaeon]